VDPFYRFVSPRFCYKDGKIYYCRARARFPGAINNWTTYERCNVDGSDVEVSFSFADPVFPFNHNPFNWANRLNSIFRVGRGFESVGDANVGVG